MMDKLTLTIKEKKYVTNVGELRQILMPFRDECPIDPLISVLYVIGEENKPTHIEIKIND